MKYFIPYFSFLALIVSLTGWVEADTSAEKKAKSAHPEAHTGMRLTRKIEKKEYYLGEAFRVEYRWESPLSFNGFRSVRLTPPLFHHAAFKMFKPYNAIDPDHKAAIGVPVAQTRIIGRYKNLTQNKPALHSLSFSKIYQSQKAGRWSLQPVSLLASYEPPPAGRRNRAWHSNYPSYFNNNFFSNEEGKSFQKISIHSEKNDLQILPLPEAGKPRDFSGLIGACEISVSANPVVLRAVEPITLTISLSGHPFLEVLELPELKNLTAFSSQFSIPEKQSTSRIFEGKKNYLRTLRPLSENVKFVPAIKISYFDPETKTYSEALSSPIPITVKPTENVSVYDIEISGSVALRNLLETNQEGIRANHISVNALRPNKHLNSSRLFYLTIFLPPVLFLVFYLLTYRARKWKKHPADAAYYFFNREIKKLSREIKTVKSSEQTNKLAGIVRAYFAKKLNISKGAHTFEELRQRLGDDLTLESLEPFYNSPDYMKNGESLASQDLKKLITQTQATIASFDKKLS